MAYLVRMPKLGMEMQEGVLLEWRVEEGDAVEADRPVAEIESEKSTTEVTARESGVLRRKLLSPGDAVEPGAPMGVIAGSSEDVTDLLAAAELPGASFDPPDATDGTGTSEMGASSAGSDPGPDPDASPDPAPDPASEPESADTTATKVGPREVPGCDRPRASPRARRRAEQLGVDLASVEPTGMEGSIIERDVEAAAGEVPAGEAPPTGSGTPASPEKPASPGEPVGARTPGEPDEPAGSSTRTVHEANELSGIRTTIANRLTESYRSAPHVTVGRDLRAGALLDAVDAAREGLDAEVSLTDLLLIAVSAALDEHPAFNATFEDGVHRTYEEHNVGVAVDVEGGLVTPVVEGVDRRTIPEVAAERRRLTDRALSGSFTSDDLSGGTFTLSNLGVFDVDSFTPIINPPEVAILGVSRVREVPVRDGAGGVAFDRRLRVDLSFDHRVVDGADAARFLSTLADRVADPWPLVLSRV